MNRIRALALIAALFSGLLQAAELKVAILVQDTAQLSMQGDLLPSSTPGADLVAAEPGDSVGSADRGREIQRRATPRRSSRAARRT